MLPIALVGVFVALFAAAVVSNRGIMPLQGVAYVAAIAGLMVLALLPFALDRFLAPDLPGFVATLLFPAAWTAVVSAVLSVLAAYLAVGSVRSLAAHAEPERTVVGRILLSASILVLPPLAYAKYRVAGRLGSGALRADSVLTGVAAIPAGIAVAGIVVSDIG